MFYGGMPFRTIRDINNAGRALRIWCLTCDRGRATQADIWRVFDQRGWSIDLIEARCHFRCRSCHQTKDILLLPATIAGEPKRPEWVDDETPPPPPEKAAALAVETFFHGMRAERKRRRRGW